MTQHPVADVGDADLPPDPDWFALMLLVMVTFAALVMLG